MIDRWYIFFVDTKKIHRLIAWRNLNFIFRTGINVFVEHRSDSLQSFYITVNAIYHAKVTTMKPAVNPGKWRFISYKTLQFDLGISLNSKTCWIWMLCIPSWCPVRQNYPVPWHFLIILCLKKCFAIRILSIL